MSTQFGSEQEEEETIGEILREERRIIFTRVLDLIGHLLPGALHLLLLAVTGMCVVPQARFALDELNEAHVENGIVLASHCGPAHAALSLAIRLRDPTSRNNTTVNHGTGAERDKMEGGAWARAFKEKGRRKETRGGEKVYENALQQQQTTARSGRATKTEREKPTARKLQIANSK